MDLWIRSQDKKSLILINRPIVVHNTQLLYKKASYVIGMGTYKTKERALEVLDEINEIKYYKYMASLDWKSFVKSILETKTTESRKTLLAMMNTYQMPKE